MGFLRTVFRRIGILRDPMDDFFARERKRMDAEYKRLDAYLESDQFKENTRQFVSALASKRDLEHTNPGEIYKTLREIWDNKGRSAAYNECLKMQERGVDLDSAMGTYESILMIATSADDLPIVRILLECGSDPNVTSANGDSALFRAITAHPEDACNKTQLIALLQEFGADVDATIRAPGMDGLGIRTLRDLARREGISIDTVAKRESEDRGCDMSTDTEVIKSILRGSLTAKGFVASAQERGFEPTNEGPMGLEMSGPNSRLILTVLDSFGGETIFTLSIKEGNEPAVSLVDEGRLIFLEPT